MDRLFYIRSSSILKPFLGTGDQEGGEKLVDISSEKGEEVVLSEKGEEAEDLSSEREEEVEDLSSSSKPHTSISMSLSL